jgi:hypothetical protein
MCPCKLCISMGGWCTCLKKLVKNSRVLDGSSRSSITKRGGEVEVEVEMLLSEDVRLGVLKGTLTGSESRWTCIWRRETWSD